MKTYTVVVINQDLQIATCHVDGETPIAAVKGACITIKEQNPDWIVMSPVALFEGKLENTITDVMQAAEKEAADHLKECEQCRADATMPHNHDQTVN